ncbi:MAG: alpha/beta hydrolase [Acidimicrobiia bacterium]
MAELTEAAGFGRHPTGFVNAGHGLRLAVYEASGLGPTVYLAHATGFCAGVWRAVVGELRAAGHGGRVVAWDARNHGASAAASHPLSWWDLAHDIPAIHAAFPPGGRAMGVGHSMGGAALLMAQVEYRLFDELVLVEPIVPGPPFLRVDHPLVGLALRRRREFPSKADARLNFAGKPPFSTWDARALDGYVDGGLVGEAGGVRLACAPEDEAEVFRGANEHAMFERLGEVDVPVGLVVGSDTDTYPVSWAAELADCLPEGSLEVVDGGTHFLPMEQPEILARRVVEAAEAG